MIMNFLCGPTLFIIAELISMRGLPVELASLISDNAATALATTIGFESDKSSLS